MNVIARKQIFRLVNILISLVFIISIFWLGTKPEWFHLFPVVPPADKFIHFIVFGFIAALLWFSSFTPNPISVFLITLMVGAADEFHQYYIPGRTPSFADFAADLAGIALIVIILNYTQQKPAALTS